jgi:hydrogenase maturation protein HypF
MVNDKIRIRIIIHGAVQGVGFRPFVYRLANELNLRGFVNNSSIGVIIEAEGSKEQLELFLKRIESEKPTLSFISSFEHSFLDNIGFESFDILESTEESEISAFILPDIAVCPDCLEEMYNPNDRRYLYPFINCTNCGPRFSIIEKLPYDRPNTSMKNFTMCPDCQREYDNPMDRRYHAQPIACPVCGPHIEFWNSKGNIISINHESLLGAVEFIRDGKIVALKGLGGFQLLVDANNSKAVARLRGRKHREEKPFALIFPSLDSIKKVCFVSDSEERSLLSPESPIVLLKRRNDIALTWQPVPEVAPDNPYLGIMLPYTPLHHLLMKELKTPIVATSGNLSEEPICTDEQIVLEKLKNIADFYLVNNRPIVRHVDDSIVRVIHNRQMILRRARGFAPLPIQIEKNSNKSIIAVGGHLKNTIALKSGKNVFISQHIGDLSTKEAFDTHKKVIEDFKLMYNVDNPVFVYDLHPEYISTKYAKSLNSESIGVQHHIAHIASCRAENCITGNALGVAFDGSGFGFDGTIWGGEFFLSNDNSFTHIAQFRQFSLPGGDKAAIEPHRSALGLLFEIWGDAIFEKSKFSLILDKFNFNELSILRKMLCQNINSYRTSSMGRIFDAIASILDIRQISSFEAQAAMMLEFCAKSNETGFYDFNINENKIHIIDWKPMIEEILFDLKNNIEKSKISAKFHNTISQIILKIAKLTGENKILLSGGCFQNAFLLENTIKLLEENNFNVYWHQRIPPNDGGISFGQVAAICCLNQD